MDALGCRTAKRGRSTRDLRSGSASDPEPELDEDDDEKERDEICMRLVWVGRGMAGTEVEPRMPTDGDAMSLRVIFLDYIFSFLRPPRKIGNPGR